MRQLILWLLIFLLVFLCGCRSSAPAVPPPTDATAHPKTEATTPSERPPAPSAETKPWDAVSKRGQLMGAAEDLDNAKEIADLYGITLVNYGNGLALFYTEEDPQTVIARGEENGWPPLSLNRTKKLH